MYIGKCIVQSVYNGNSITNLFSQLLLEPSTSVSLLQACSSCDDTGILVLMSPWALQNYKLILEIGLSLVFMKSNNMSYLFSHDIHSISNIGRIRLSILVDYVFSNGLCVAIFNRPRKASDYQILF